MITRGELQTAHVAARAALVKIGYSAWVSDEQIDVVVYEVLKALGEYKEAAANEKKAAEAAKPA